MYALNKNKIIYSFILIFFIFIDGHAYKAGSSTSAGQQRSAEKGLKDNRYFLYFINPTVTNYGSPVDKKFFKRIIQRDILSQFFYMRFLFSDSWREIRKTQKDLIDLYRKNLKKEIKNTKIILNQFAAQAIHSPDIRAKKYLYLGYRKAKLSEIFMIMADNYRPTLYSMRLYKYVHAIKKIKEAKRYAFLTLIQLKHPRNIKFKAGQLTFKEIEEKIELYTNSSKQKNEFILAHNDSHYKYKDNKSFYDIVWENPALEELEEFQKYLKSDN